MRFEVLTILYQILITKNVNRKLDGVIMKKVLVRIDNISEFLEAGASEFHMNSNMILTSGAKDYLRNKGIKIVQNSKGRGPEVQQKKKCKLDENSLSTVVARIVSILRKDLKVKDASKIERVTHRVLMELNNK